MAAGFIRVRLTRITGVDLPLFDFDYDLTWAALFLSADGTVYGRYGSRDARSADGRMSLAGLRYALQAALAAHRLHAGKAAAAGGRAPLLAEDFPEAKALLIRGACVHCHQVNEFRREQMQASGRWRRDLAWAYPLPENVGLTLEVDRGNRVRSVTPGSAARRAGFRPGDVLSTINGTAVASTADAQYGLNRAPENGTIPVTWTRGGRQMAGSLKLRPGWRKADITWRPSLRELVPDLPVSGRDLTAAQKKALGLPAGRLAFRQSRPVHSQLQAAGVQEGDVIVGIDDWLPAVKLEQFREAVRTRYLVGDRVVLRVLRGGKTLRLPLTLQ
jgi:hypothetical protein